MTPVPVTMIAVLIVAVAGMLGYSTGDDDIVRSWVLGGLIVAIIFVIAIVTISFNRPRSKKQK